MNGDLTISDHNYGGYNTLLKLDGGDDGIGGTGPGNTLVNFVNTSYGLSVTFDIGMNENHMFFMGYNGLYIDPFTSRVGIGATGPAEFNVVGTGKFTIGVTAPTITIPGGQIGDILTNNGSGNASWSSPLPTYQGPNWIFGGPWLWKADKLKVGTLYYTTLIQDFDPFIQGQYDDHTYHMQSDWDLLIHTTDSSRTFTLADYRSSNFINTNVGIGTTSPTEKLDVNGKIKTSNFQMTTGAGAGLILQSDADGNASWAPVLEGLSLTQSGQIYIDYNINPEVLKSLGYEGARDEIETAQFHLNNASGNLVSRIADFAKIAVAKLTAGFIRADTIKTKTLVNETSIAQDIVTDTIVTKDATVSG
ncbi:MAG TPA: hypothetical protein P5562_03815, partial [Candidatus Woesebacteria bacterium]|nr:hypothetical protein [Candidatus Woesebacteria bacterium]